MQLSDHSLNHLCGIVAKYPEGSENVKNACTALLRHCGRWSATEDLASLGVAVIQAKTMVGLQTSVPDRKITYESLGVLQSQKEGLHAFKGLPQEDKSFYKKEFVLAISTLGEWVWDDMTNELPDELYEVIHHTHMILVDAQCFCDSAY